MPPYAKRKAKNCKRRTCRPPTLPISGFASKAIPRKSAPNWQKRLRSLLKKATFSLISSTKIRRKEFFTQRSYWLPPSKRKLLARTRPCEKRLHGEIRGWEKDIPVRQQFSSRRHRQYV